MQKRILLAVCILYPCLAFPKVSSPVMAHAATVNITPPLEMIYTLGGYGERMNKPATAVHDSIFAKALVIKQDDRKYALVTLDLLGLPSNVRPELLRRISGRGWNSTNVMLLPSHSHGSLEMEALNNRNLLNIPQLGIYQPELLEFLLQKLENLLTAADRDYQEVVIGTKSGWIEGMNRNRRKDPETDREMIVTRIDLPGHMPLAVLVNWTAHPTFLGANDMEVSAEWPGYLQQELAALIGQNVTTLFYNGSEGDMAPLLNDPVTGDYEKIRVYGRKIAASAYNIYKEITPRTVLQFSYCSETIQLPEHQAHPAFMKTGGEEYGLTEGTVKTVLDILCPSTVEIGAVRIGDLVIAGVPGEMTAVLGLQIKRSLKNSEVRYLAIGGLANEWISYILSEDQYLHGEGYESSMSFYGPQIGRVLSEKIIKNASRLVR